MEPILKELNVQLAEAVHRFEDDLKAIRSNRPSVELLENVKVSYYEQMVPVIQLGSLSVNPPREITISAWDKNAVGAIMKAIDDAKIGFATSNDGNIIHATLSALTDERREELSRTIKKKAEEVRIQIRMHRDEAMKKLKGEESAGTATEDDVFSGKEKIQEMTNDANKKIEARIEGKLKEIQE